MDTQRLKDLAGIINEEMSDADFQQLQTEIETTMARLQELQAQYRQMTGRDYVAGGRM